ncbi:MAG: porin [Pseudomonadales bacterium]|nr:porin [Pseudomonadales bacterium]
MKAYTPLGVAAAVATTLSVCSVDASAVDLPVTLYGKINVSYDSRDNADDDFFSNTSRLGLKGDYELNDRLSVIYQIEQDVDVAHGGTDIDTLFGMRNTFVGVKGDFGKVLFGAHDTPLKRAQGKIDLFNDQVGDIKNVVVGEVRATDSWFYESPALAESIRVSAAWVPSDSDFDSSQSVMVSYEPDNLYLAFGYDADMRKNDKSTGSTKVYDSVRGVAQYKIDSWQFGLLLQSSEQQNKAGADNETGYTVSVQKTLGDIALKFQHGDSDIVAADVRSTLVGIDYKVAKGTRVYAYYWDYDKGGDADVLSVGFEYKF